MANPLSEILDTLAQVKLATVVAQGIGVTVPSVLTTFETDAVAALSSIEGFEPPSSLTNDLNDVSEAATALSGLASGPTMPDLIVALQRIPTTAADLAAGELAIIGQVQARFAGVVDTVVIGAYRESGQFAKIVDSGTTDTASIS
jgi:hypothetical protein